MSYKALYFDEVKQDIQEGKSWYRLQQKGLDKRFAQDIKVAIIRILKMPTAHAIRYKNIRIAHADVFPYSIHYYIDELAELIVITAVIHNKRHPDIARERE